MISFDKFCMKMNENGMIVPIWPYIKWSFELYIKWAWEIPNVSWVIGQKPRNIAKKFDFFDILYNYNTSTGFIQGKWKIWKIVEKSTSFDLAGNSAEHFQMDQKFWEYIVCRSNGCYSTFWSYTILKGGRHSERYKLNSIRKLKVH